MAQHKDEAGVIENKKRKSQRINGANNPESPFKFKFGRPHVEQLTLLTHDIAFQFQDKSRRILVDAAATSIG